MIVVVDQTTGIAVDVDQVYDARFFDSVPAPDGTIPAGDLPRKYWRDPSTGLIARRPIADLIKEFPDEYKKARLQFILNQINTAASIADVQACLKLVLREALR